MYDHLTVEGSLTCAVGERDCVEPSCPGSGLLTQQSAAVCGGSRDDSACPPPSRCEASETWGAGGQGAGGIHCNTTLGRYFMGESLGTRP